MKPLRVAVIGAGYIAGKKYLPALAALRDRLELAAVCDLDEGAARRLASRHGAPPVFADAAVMADAVRPDLAVICTPPRTHAGVAAAVIARGCHVLIEKPMATSVVECDRIAEAARAHGVKVCVAHTDLFYPPVQRARAMLAAGAIGEFMGMQIWFSTPTSYMTSVPDHWAHRLPGGVIGETGPHAVYLTLAFIRPVSQVIASGIKCLPFPWSRFEDYRITLIGERAASTVTSIYTTSHWAATVDLWGTGGILKLDLELMSLARYRRPTLRPWDVGTSGIAEAAQRVGDAVRTGARVAMRRFRNTHEVLLKAFADSLIHGGDPPVSADDGREAVRVMTMIGEQLEHEHPRN